MRFLGADFARGGAVSPNKSNAIKKKNSRKLSRKLSKVCPVYVPVP